ncbi:MAG: FAD:protein FMN transferase, partial [Gemmatimonadetes bacterium]|nr:FAD:protein FMN transferase [Gemmatimonadota bacterium]
MIRSRLLELGLEPVGGRPTSRMSRVGRRAYRVDAERAAMGTRVAVSVIGGSRDRLETAVGEAFEEMDRLIAIFTRYESASAVSVLNDAGRLDLPPPELAALLRRAGRFHRRTGGAFDVSVAPLVDLFQRRRVAAGATPPGPTVTPTPAEIAGAMAVVGADRIRATAREIRLDRSGMRVTLDGIAKGFIVDAMVGALERRRVRRYLVDGGGDIRTRGRAGERRPWTVAVRDPAGNATPLDVVRPGNGALATSGGYERYHAGDPRFHHLVDGASGTSPRRTA